MIEQTLSYARMLIEAAQPREAYRVLTEVAPVAVLEDPEVIEMARVLAIQIDQAFDDEDYLKRYGAYDNGGMPNEPFSDTNLMRLFRAQATVHFAKAAQPKRYLSVGGGEGSVPKAVLEVCPDTQLVLSELLAVGGEVFKALNEVFPNRVSVTGRYDTNLNEIETGFDMIECLEVVEHVVDDALFLNNLNAALNVGGVLLLSTPNSVDWCERKLVTEFGESNWYHHLTAYTPRSLARKLVTAGFQPTIFYVDKCLYAVATKVCSPNEVGMVDYDSAHEANSEVELSGLIGKALRVKTPLVVQMPMFDRAVRVVAMGGTVLV